MRTTSRMRSTLSRISGPGRRRTSRPKPTFWATVMLGQIAYDWKIIDMPRFSGGRARGRGDRAPVQLDGALARVEKAGDHAQRGGLAAARRAEQRDELAARQRQRRAIHRREGAEAAGDLAQDQLAHAAAPSLERRSMKSRPTSRKPIITRATVTITRTSPMEARISKLPSSLLSNSSTESTWVPVV